MCIRTLSILPDKFDDTALSCDLSSSRPSPKTQFPGVIPRGRQVLEEYVGSWKMKEDQMNLSAWVKSKQSSSSYIQNSVRRSTLIFFLNIDNIISIFRHVFQFPLLNFYSSLINYERSQLSFPITFPQVLTSLVNSYLPHPFYSFTPITQFLIIYRCITDCSQDASIWGYKYNKPKQILCHPRHTTMMQAVYY